MNYPVVKDESPKSYTINISLPKIPFNPSSASLTSIKVQPSNNLILSWSNLGYKVPTRNNHYKQILHNLHGFVEPGNIVAVLGASGAGKSSFLNVLSGRVPPEYTTGEVAINGRTIPIKHASRYCTQEEALFGSLTVYETLYYAAEFNLPKSMDKKEKQIIILDLMKEFGLLDVYHTKIGTPLMKGCSGGQIRRVSVAAQVIGIKNEILFLDEPTSGLDSVAASAIISSVCSLSKRQNIPVIATIHQPSTETFELFTHFLLLGQGSTVYFGPREEAIGYFEKIGFPIPLRSNPAYVYLQLTNTDFTSGSDSTKVQYLCEKFQNSEIHQNTLTQIEDLQQRPLSSNATDSLGYKNGFFYQTKILLARGLLNALKNPLAYWIRIGMYIALAILMGTTWFRMDLDQSRVADRLSALLFALTFLSFMSVAGIPAFLEERLVFLRESANGLYSIESYVISNLLISIPFITLITLSYTGIAYFLMGLNTSDSLERVFIFILYLFVNLMISEAQVVLISVLIPIFVAALSVLALFGGLWLLVQGFFIKKENIPAFWRYSFHTIDFQKYTYELLVNNEFKGLEFNCGSTCQCVIPSVNRTMSVQETYCQFSGEDVLSYYDYLNIPFLTHTLILIGIFCVFKIFTYGILKVKMRRT